MLYGFYENMYRKKKIRRQAQVFFFVFFNLIHFDVPDHHSYIS